MKVRYWWVNQNQTFRQEIDGGYLWSPKRNRNGHRNPFYEFMREVAPGDIVVIYGAGAIGLLTAMCAFQRGAVQVFVVDAIPDSKDHALVMKSTVPCGTGAAR